MNSCVAHYRHTWLHVEDVQLSIDTQVSILHAYCIHFLALSAERAWKQHLSSNKHTQHPDFGF